jgi:predicted O-linked N-acetylglucosamine transferase (SPINDLY family)
MSNKINKLIQKIIDYIENGQLENADKLLDSILVIDTLNFDALFMKGVIFGMQSKYGSCKSYLLKAEKLNPNHAFLQYNLAKALSELGEETEALKHHIRTTQLIPISHEAWYNLGRCYLNQKLFNEALNSFNKALGLKNDYAEAYFNQGNALQGLRHFGEAIKSYEKAIELRREYTEAYNNKGVVLCECERYDEAINSYKNAIELNSEYAEAYYNCGNVFIKLKKWDQALRSLDKTVELNAEYAEAYMNRGIVLRELNRLDESLSNFNFAVGLKLDYADAYMNRGVVLQEQKRFPEALLDYDKTINLKPNYAEAYFNRGLVLHRLNRLGEALNAYGRAIELKPNYAEAFNNSGLIFLERLHLEKALSYFNKAIDLKNDFVETYINRGDLFYELRRYQEALTSYERANQMSPSYEYLLGNILHTKMMLCEWLDFETSANNLLFEINNNKKATPPFNVLSVIDSPAIQLNVAKIFIKDKYPFKPLIGPIIRAKRNGKIKIGYYSSDFREHPVSYLTAGYLELHDKSRFELIGFQLGQPDNSKMFKRLVSLFDEFIDVRLFTDQAVAQISRDMQIDIAVDLCGHTSKGRGVKIFSYRASPIQINYLGYAGTVGAEYYDYIIADKVVVPDYHQIDYSEKIIYLPGSYLPHDRSQNISNREFSKQECGLPSEGFIFCCFNAVYKINPVIFDSWMRILRSNERSVLWLSSQNNKVVDNLRAEAKKRGIDSNRLIFADREPLMEDHLARHKLADLFLDTSPYNAHTTTLDALWAGLPVLTCAGKSFASRVAASALSAIDLPELITTTKAEYEDLAIELSFNLEKLKSIKEKLDRNRLTTPLFDTPRYTKNIESAFIHIYERYQAELTTEHVYIEA